MDVVDYISRQILYEDNHLLLLNKRAGDIVQGDKTGTEPLLDKAKTYIKTRYNKPGNVYLGLPHRLDQPVSGAVIFARTSKSLARLNQMFQNREITKIYWAVVKTRPSDDEALLVHHMSRNREKNKSYAFKSPRKDSQKAELKYKLIASSDHYHLIEVALLTGRHHQIRSQLSVIACPIKGDLKYGASRPNADASIHLHARKLLFAHPVSGEMIQIIAPVPKDPLWEYFEKTAG